MGLYRIIFNYSMCKVHWCGYITYLNSSINVNFLSSLPALFVEVHHSGQLVLDLHSHICLHLDGLPAYYL